MSFIIIIITIVVAIETFLTDHDVLVLMSIIQLLLFLLNWFNFVVHNRT